MSGTFQSKDPANKMMSTEDGGELEMGVSKKQDKNASQAPSESRWLVVMANHHEEIRQARKGLECTVMFRNTICELDNVGVVTKLSRFRCSVRDALRW